MTWLGVCIEQQWKDTQAGSGVSRFDKYRFEISLLLASSSKQIGGRRPRTRK
jgi:hypothetical protein